MTETNTQKLMFFEKLSELIYTDFGIMNRKERIKKALYGEFWLEYWIENPCNQAPTPEDIKYLQQKRYITPLIDYELALCTSLKELIANDYETLTSTKNLHEFHLILKEELKRRDIPVLDRDSFQLDIRAKKQGKIITETTKQQFRQSGERCIFCGSKNVRSFNHEEWKCYTCSKRFRKA